MSHVSRPSDPPSSEPSKDAIEVAPSNGSITTVGHWYRHGHFKNDDEARGAFRLAFQQYVDGLGTSLASWMGISAVEAKAYKLHGTLPKRRR